MARQLFGGGWTDEKLSIIQKYLRAYTTIMRKHDYFKYAYIDAFAGTGYRESEVSGMSQNELFPDLRKEDFKRLRDGSARIALRIQPPFRRYIFIEQDKNRFDELQQLKEDFPVKSDDILLVNAEANEWLVDRCKHYDWKQHRAVVFLDPFGMQVEWRTVEAIAGTEAIDLWNLFPVGAAVNRLLVRDGEIPEAWQEKLDSVLGTHDWYDIFYETHPDLMGEIRSQKIISLEGIGRYYVDRLRSVFRHVAERPRPLFNSTGVPLYWLCFASPNETAARIAQDILNRPS